MELILGFSLAINALFIGLLSWGIYAGKKKTREVEKQIDNMAKELSHQYYEIYKDWMTHA